MIGRITSRLQDFFATKNDLLILTTSGSGGMEAAVVNTLSPGDKVLAVSIGSFGDRFAEIAKIYGADVQKLSFEWGTAADPDEIRKALSADSFKAVLVTHNETSTGITNDLAAIAKAVHEFDPSTRSGQGVLLIVDAVSSMGSMPVETDAWGLDVVVSGSQKGWMVPPGLAMVAMSQKAWEASAQATMPRFYFDLARAKDFLKRGQTPWTPAVSLFYGMDMALETLARDGKEAVFERHRQFGQQTRDGVKAMGLRLFADERYASNTVTAVRTPDGVEANQLRRLVQQDFNVVLAEGQGKLAGNVFRIGHLGYCSEKDIDDTLLALRETFAKLGHPVPIG